MPVDPGFHLSTTTGAARTFRSEQPIRVRPVGESVEVEEKPALVITDPEGFLWVTATVELLKIEEDYTYAGFAWQGSVATNQRGDFLTVGGALDQPGIYLVSAVTLATAPPATVMPLSRLQLGVCLFEVRAATDEPRRHTELVQSVADILERRERLVLEGIGKDPDEHGVRTHEVLVFLKNCLVSQRMRLRGCEIVPHEAMTVASEFDCMERYRPFAEREAVLGNYRSEQPTAVVHFPRVYATSPEEAGGLAWDHVEILRHAFSVYRNAPAVAFGEILGEVGTTATKYRIHLQGYRGNLMTGSLAGESPRDFAEFAVSVAAGDPRLRAFVRKYSEALSERDMGMAYFRLWNLAESIATTKRERPTGKSAVESLIKSALSRYTQGFASELPDARMTSFRDVLDVWYQRRNCVAHFGDCYPNDAAVCQPNPIHRKCRDARNEMTAKSGRCDVFTDDYLRCLRSTVLGLVMSEVRASKPSAQER